METCDADVENAIPNGSPLFQAVTVVKVANGVAISTKQSSSAGLGPWKCEPVYGGTDVPEPFENCEYTSLSKPML